MVRPNHIAVAMVLMLCSWSADAQGGSVSADPGPPMNPGGAPGTGQPPTLTDDQSAAIYLESRVVHLGDGQFDEIDSAVMGTFMGEGIAMAFAADRPIEATVVLVSVHRINTDGAATVRIGNAADSVTRTSGSVLGNIDYAHNDSSWQSPRIQTGQAGTYAVTVVCNDTGLNEPFVDDFVFGPCILVYQPADAVVTSVTLTGSGQAGGTAAGTVGGPPTMEYLPGTRLDALSGGQAATWSGTWHIAHTGNTMVFLRAHGGAVGFAGVVIPLTGGASPVILGTQGTQWITPGGGGQWQQLTEPCLPFAVGASVPASNALAESPARLGPWYVTFAGDTGGRWLVIGDSNCQISLSDSGEILYYDRALGTTHSFTE